MCLFTCNITKKKKETRYMRVYVCQRTWRLFSGASAPFFPRGAPRSRGQLGGDGGPPLRLPFSYPTRIACL